MFRILFFALFLMLAGCSSNNYEAPVVNAWHQKNSASNFYVVQSGDTIYSVAFAFSIDYRDLATANNLQPPYLLHAGERLRMTHAPAVGATPLRYIPTQAAQSARVVRSTEFVQKHTILQHRTYFSLHPPPVFTHQWHWPTNGRVISVFSRQPSGQPGISIAGRLGQPIRAAASGEVVYSGDGVRGYGNLIIIKHDDNYLSAYAFNQANLVFVNEHVRAGKVIARMGQNDAGRTLLYFEIRCDGVPQNPLRLLK